MSIVKKFYLAGPVTGLPEGNKPAFETATRTLRSAGLIVISPLEMDTPEEFAATMSDQYGGVYWQRMVHDFKTVIEVDGIVLLDGWEKSKGARIEAFTALSLTKEFWRFYGDTETVHPMRSDEVRRLIQENMP